MKYTPNYELKKPEQDDFYNVEDFNENADIIDQALKAHDDALATKETTAGAQAKAEAAAAAAVAAHDTNVAAHGGIYRKNLLHNWDFRNPVNQRGQSSYSVSNYTIDRWRTNDASISVNINSGYITVSNNGAAEKHFLQQLEFMVPGDYTVSLLLANGDILSESLNVNDSVAGGSGGSSVKSLTAGLRVQIGDFSSKPAFKLLIAPGYSFNIVAIKLELGSVSTLANDPPADFGEELRKCQRYLFNAIDTPASGVGAALGTGIALSATEIRILLPIPAHMRSIAATVILSSPSHFQCVGASTLNISALAYGATSSNSVMLIATVTGATPGQSYYLRRATGATDGHLLISKEL